jgi:hypothetical protein
MSVVRTDRPTMTERGTTHCATKMGCCCKITSWNMMAGRK